MSSEHRQACDEPVLKSKSSEPMLAKKRSWAFIVLVRMATDLWGSQ
jgi:hypothetical protein